MITWIQEFLNGKISNERFWNNVIDISSRFYQRRQTWRIIFQTFNLLEESGSVITLRSFESGVGDSAKNTKFWLTMIRFLILWSKKEYPRRILNEIMSYLPFYLINHYYYVDF